MGTLLLRVGVGFVLAGIIIPLLYILSKQNYLLFHTGIEYTGSMIAAAFFIVIYISQKTFGSNKMVFLSIAYLAAGCIDIFHAMAFKGMGVFPQFEGVNFAAQFWVTARMTEALGLLIFAYTLPRVFSIAENKRILFLWIFFIILSIVVIYTGHFPTCFVVGKGLTAFKIGAEYVIITVLVLAALLSYRKRDLFDNYPMIMGSIIMTIISELCFTLYTGPFDGFNFMGHIFKALAFFMMFIAFIQSGLENPLKELRQSEGTKSNSQ